LFRGGIGCELIGGWFAELHGTANLTYATITTVEESLEMAGVIIFIWALLVYIADNYKEVRFRFEGVRAEVRMVQIRAGKAFCLGSLSHEYYRARFGFHRSFH
jgi:hypothetical protein